MKVARPKGSKNKPKEPGASPKERKKRAPSANGTVSTNHNEVKASDLTPEQQQALFFHHKKNYEKQLAAKKKADADFKNACKQAKSEGISVEEIKLSCMDPDKLSSFFREKVESLHRVAQYMGLPEGHQFNFSFDTADRRPAEDKAFDDGKRAGLSGETCDPPYAHHLPQANQWRQGWNEGQEVLRAGFKQKAEEQRNEDADEFSDLEGGNQGEDVLGTASEAGGGFSASETASEAAERATH